MSAPDPRVLQALDRVRQANFTAASLSRHIFFIPREALGTELAQMRLDLSVAAGQLAAVADELPLNSPLARRRTCRVCGCTDADCRQCIAKTGAPCWWVGPDLCSACADPDTNRAGPRPARDPAP
jgi:hypothetical protein